MIAYLKGKLVAVDFEKVIVELQGVGYGVSLSVRSASRLQVGDEVQLHVSEIIREQAFDLYGFLSVGEQKLFETLNKVSGVGPRLALAILGLGEANDIASAVTSEDDKFFSRAPGVGKKLAERLIIELRDKVSGSFYSTDSTTALPSATTDAHGALIALGFSADDAKLMLKDIDEGLSVEQQITLALKSR